jgi:hypothetical protein
MCPPAHVTGRPHTSIRGAGRPAPHAFAEEESNAVPRTVVPQRRHACGEVSPQVLNPRQNQQLVRVLVHLLVRAPITRQAQVGVFVDKAGCDPVRPEIVLADPHVGCRLKRLDRAHGLDPPILDPHRGIAHRRLTGPIDQARAVEHRCLHESAFARRQGTSQGRLVPSPAFCRREVFAG